MRVFVQAGLVLFLAMSEGLASNEAFQLIQERKLYESKLSDEQSSLVWYCILHPQTTLALSAAGGAVAAIIDENMDGSLKAALGVVGVIGANYCYNYPADCTEVGAEIAHRGYNINSYQEKIKAIDAQIASLQGRYRNDDEY